MTYKVGDLLELYNGWTNTWDPAIVVILSPHTEEVGVAITESTCLVYAGRRTNYAMPLDRLRRREL